MFSRPVESRLSQRMSKEGCSRREDCEFRVRLLVAGSVSIFSGCPLVEQSSSTCCGWYKSWIWGEKRRISDEDIGVDVISGRVYASLLRSHQMADRSFVLRHECSNDFVWLSNRVILVAEGREAGCWEKRIWDLKEDMYFVVEPPDWTNDNTKWTGYLTTKIPVEHFFDFNRKDFNLFS